MRKSGKLLSMALAASMVLSLAACSGGGSESSAAASEAATTAAETAGEAEAASSEASSGAASGETYTVGICQLVQHDALDAATQGFKDALVDELGDAVTFD